MKNTIKFLGILVLFAALAFTSCLEKGGVIEVTNEYKKTVLGVTVTATVDVSVYKDINLLDPVAKGTIEYGRTQKFTINEDGTYSVRATIENLPVYTSGPLILLGGNSVQVTIKEGL